ncbi:CRAL/TRIO domain-containing protein [Aulographum hederae CBS 113979]|uniref:CRAL/TRIO domain-containing protein n=1 Tax=Aulographum hederae CBS 113979 TaxID=1176131 RepID=A0A6G1GNV4_9PEZI|nr:CRAL/TRIO domain-containing protein [Aulographum hederae CBS 113979]
MSTTEPAAGSGNVLGEKDLKNLAIAEPAEVDSSSKASTTEDAKPVEESVPVPPTQSTGDPTKIPIAHPVAGAIPQTHATLTPEQEKKYNDLLDTVSAWTEVPIISDRNAKKEPITDDDRMWLTRECLLRYLRATKWSPIDAPKRLLATLTWRREYGVLGFTPEYISPEQETGKQVALGYDVEGRPCLYLDPSKQNTKPADRQLHHLVYMMDRVIDLMGPGQETLALVINFAGPSGGGNPSVTQGKQTLNILQNHYPERLGRALISKLPWFISTFFKLISPFIDPVTREKMKFSEPLTNHVPTEQLWTNYGGTHEFTYDHSVYWPALNELCKTRRNEMKARWEKAGKKVGENEAYLRGGDVPSVGSINAGKENQAPETTAPADSSAVA